ncbi:hypothetical protein BH10CYA1_BH10CYA1_26580 [soil metagenome]
MPSNFLWRESLAFASAVIVIAGGSCAFAETTTTKTTTTTEATTAAPTSTTPSTVGGQLSDPHYPINVPATSRTEATMKARLGAGRVNPFAQPAGALKPLFDAPDLKQLKALPKLHLPPPPKFVLAPPPPPTETILPGLAAQSVGQAGSGASATQMPEPPDKPLIAEKMKLVGVLADRAFFTFTDSALRRANKFPSTLVLANGEQFESVHLISVNPNSVVLEEDGERITKELERIR